MKKVTALIILMTQILTYNKVHPFNFDYEQYMRNAKNSVENEKINLVPSAIAQEYLISLFSKSKHIDNVLKNFNVASEYLHVNFENFNKFYNNLSLNNVNNLTKYKEILNIKNNLEKIIDSSRNALYTYRESEINLLELKNSLNNYCENTSKLVNAKGLVLTPLPFSAPSITPDLESLENEKKEVLNNIYIGSSVVAGAVSFASPVLGIAVGALITVTASFISEMIFGYKRKKKEQEVEEINRKIRQKHKEASEWYLNNTILKKPSEIKSIALNMCKSPTYSINIQSNGNNQTEEISIFNRILSFDKTITDSLNKAFNINGNIHYTAEESKKLKNLFAYGNGNIIDPEWLQYNDNITINFINMVKKIENLKHNISEIRKELAKKMAKADIERIDKMHESSKNLKNAAEVIYQNIGTQLTKELFDNYNKSKNSCLEYKEINNNIFERIEILKNIALEKYKDDFNKNDVLFTERLPNLISTIHKIKNIREKRVCED